MRSWLIDIIRLGGGDDTVVKNPHDHNQYQAMVLENGLRVLLIHDEQAVYNAIAVNVNAGSQNDPAQRQGLAHLLEHMLFLGTEKYPDPNSYQAFIKQHGGYENAATSGTNTEYVLKIKPEACVEAMDRFSQFFIAPQLYQDYIEREVNAVDSEFHLCAQDDCRRSRILLHRTSNSQHPFSQFKYGNRASLAYDQDYRQLRHDLQSFYQQHYTPNRMSLVIVGKQPLAQLATMVRNSFGQIANKVTAKPQFTVDALGPEFNRVLEIKTIQQLPPMEMFLLFKMPSQRHEYQHHSIWFLRFLLRLSGPGGLQHHLFQQGWISQPYSVYDIAVTGQQEILGVDLRLTASGRAQQDAVLQSVFAYCRFLRQQDAASLQPLWHDFHASMLREENFSAHFAELDLACTYGAAMHYLPPTEYIIAHEYTPNTYFDITKLQQLLANLTPDNLLLGKMAPDLATDQIEQYYGIQYNNKLVDNASKDKWRQVPNNLLDLSCWQLPQPSKLLPTSFKLLRDNQQLMPQVLLDINGVRLWHKQSSSFREPKVLLKSIFHNSIAGDTVQHFLLQQLMAAALADNMQAHATELSLAGADSGFAATVVGLQMRLYMFSDNCETIFKLVMHELRNITIDQRNLQNAKSLLQQALKNALLAEPYAQNQRYLEDVLYEISYTVAEQLAALPAITQADLQQYIQQYWRTFNTTMFCNGNISAQHAQQLAQFVQQPPLISLPQVRLAAYKQGARYAVPFKVQHTDSSIIKFIATTDNTARAAMQMDLLGNMMDADFFHQLRTQQQLGYTVAVIASNYQAYAGIGFLVESPQYNPTEILRRIDQFLVDFQVKLQYLPDSELQKYVQSLRFTYNEPMLSLADDTNKYWTYIAQDFPQFDFVQQKLAALQDMKLTDVQDFLRITIMQLQTGYEIVVYTGDDLSMALPGYNLIPATSTARYPRP